MNARSARWLATGALLALMVAGCGESGAEAPSGTSPPTTDQTTQTSEPGSSAGSTTLGNTTTTTVAVPGS